MGSALGIGRQPKVGQGVEIQLLHLRPRPGRAAEEDQTGLDARVEVEAVDLDHLPQHLPAIVRHELFEHHREGDAMEGILGAGGVHEMEGCFDQLGRFFHRQLRIHERQV